MMMMMMMMMMMIVLIRPFVLLCHNSSSFFFFSSSLIITDTLLRIALRWQRAYPFPELLSVISSLEDPQVPRRAKDALRMLAFMQDDVLMASYEACSSSSYLISSHLITSHLISHHLITTSFLFSDTLHYIFRSSLFPHHHLSSDSDVL